MRTTIISLACLLVLTFGLTSCMQQTDVAAVRATIEEMSEQQAEAMLGDDTEAKVAVYADDAISMPPNSSPLKGKEEIKAWYGTWTEAGVKITAMKLTTVEVGAAGKMAYEIGDYEMTMEIPEAGEMSDNGKYVAIWKQQGDGSWKIHADIWNTNLPVPGMEEEKK